MAIKGGGAGGSGGVHALDGADHSLTGKTDGQIIKATSPTTFGFEDDIDQINLTIDGAGSVITTGVKADVVVEAPCVVVSWTLLADVAGAIVIDVWNDTYANYPPTDADAMPGAGHEPTIAATNAKAQDPDASDWAHVTIAGGSTLRFNVDSCTTITRVHLSLKVRRT